MHVETYLMCFSKMTFLTHKSLKNSFFTLFFVHPDFQVSKADSQAVVIL